MKMKSKYILPICLIVATLFFGISGTTYAKTDNAKGIQKKIPVEISNVFATSSTASFENVSTGTVTWITNMASDAKVYIATSSPVLSSNYLVWTVPTSSVAHRVDMYNLVASTTYYYLVVSKNNYSNVATSSELSFNTPDLTQRNFLPIANEEFSSYINGSVVGQGGWESYLNGENFLVNTNTCYNCPKQLSVSALGDNIIVKSTSTHILNGKQSLYVKTQDRANWGSYLDGNVQIRVSEGPWASGEPDSPFAAVTFRTDGNIAYYDSTLDSYVNFGTYDDDSWTPIDIQWRAFDRAARYSATNGGTWTQWHTFKNADSFSGFDYVGLEFVNPSGSGGAHFDSLSSGFNP